MTYGKWAMTVIYNCDTRKYNATMNTEKGFIDFWEDMDYNTLKKAVYDITGVQILNRNRMIFEKLSDFEKIATIDASGGKIGDCRVTLNDIKMGWRPLLPCNVEMAVM